MPSRDRTYRTEAIVLRRKDFGEADRMLTLLTPERGKVRVVAKGIRKPASRKAGHLELFMRSKLLIAKGRELDLITQAETVSAYRPLREYLLRGAYAAYMVELVDRFTPDEQENREMYNLLRHGFEWLCESPDLALTVRYYELHLLGLAGFQPQLHQCVVGREKIVAEDQFFSPADGGVVCPRCGEEHPDAQHLSLDALKYLRYFQTQPYTKAVSLKIRPGLHSEIEHVLARYIANVLERQLKSIEFLKLVRREHTL
jgi:DNA repair protein RecO (recombination protein O)